jgi:hypothetical protein
MKSCESFLPYAFPVIVGRIGVASTEATNRMGNDAVEQHYVQLLVENSEEIRLSLVVMLDEIVKRAGKATDLYVDDLCTIIVRTCMDPYPEIKKVRSGAYAGGILKLTL